MRKSIPMRSVMVSVMVLRSIKTDVNILLLQRASAYLRGEWSYVGGHVKSGELAWQTALRELKEETGLIPTSFYATSFCEQFYNPADDVIEVVPGFVAFVAHNAEVRLNHEHSHYRWVTLSEASKKLPFASQRVLLDHLEKDFVNKAPSPHLRLDKHV